MAPHDPAPRSVSAVPPPPAGRAPRPRPRPAIRALDWSSGRPLNGRYRMLSKLGEGGMGSVYLCEDVLLRRKVALKTLFADRSVTDEDLERFRREVAIAHAINHPNLARTYDLGEAAGVHYLTMEYLEGRTLVDRLREGPALTSAEVRKLAIPLCEGLRAAHRAGVVHRDLKPANLMLVPDERQVVVMDFGIAGQAGGDDGALPEMTDGANTPWEVTSAGRGTPTYMAPEQWQGERGDARTDVYALGVILFVSLARRAPFRAETSEALGELHQTAAPPALQSVVPGVDKELAALVRDCLAKDPARRPQGMDEVLDRLQRGQRQRSYVLAVLATSLVTALLLGLVGLGLWTLATRAVIREMRPAMGRLAEVIALQIDPADLDQVRTDKDIDGEPFERVHDVLATYKARNPEVSALYVMRPTAQADQYAFVVDLLPADTDVDKNGRIDAAEKGSPPGMAYDGTDSPNMARALASPTPLADEDFVADAWGVSLSGYAAVRGQDDGPRSKARYFVGADARNDQLARLKIQLLALFGVVWLVVTVGYAVMRFVIERRRV